MMRNQLKTLPNLLSLARIFLTPLCLYLIHIHHPYRLSFFILLIASDFFDGWYARKFNQVTPLGSVLDPIADKFLINSILIALVGTDGISYLWPLLFIARDSLVSSLRLFAEREGREIPVHFLGKIKTSLQAVALSTVLYAPEAFYTQICLGLALLAALFSGAIYAVEFYKSILQRS